MRYIITEKDFHYVPLEMAKEETGFDQRVVTKEFTKEVYSFREVLNECMLFMDTFKCVNPVKWFENSLITLVSNSDTDNPKHPEYLYTERHMMDVEFSE